MDADAWGDGVIAVQTDFGIEFVDHDIEIAIAVEVAEGHALGDAGLVEVPCAAVIGEAPMAEVAPGGSAGGETFEPGAEGDAVAFAGAAGGDVPFDVIGDVEVHRIAFVATGDEEILEAVEIDIEESDAPGPVGGFDAGEVGDLGEGAVAEVPVEGVVPCGGATGCVGRGGGDGSPAGELGHAAQMGSAEHVGDEQVGEAIAVHVGDIGAHGEVGGVAQGGFVGLDEPAVAPIPPEAVGGMEIIGDKEIREAIAVEVAEQGAKPPIHERTGGRSVVELEVARVPVDAGEVALTVIEVEVVLEPVLETFDAAIGVESGGEPTLEVGFGDGSAIDAVEFGTALDHAIGEPDAGLIHEGDSAVLGDVEIQIAVVVDIGEGEGHGRAPGFEAGVVGEREEPAGAIVPEGLDTGEEGAGDQVGMTVAIEIGEGDTGVERGGVGEMGLGDGGEPELTEIAEDDGGGFEACDDEIGELVSVEIGDGDAGAIEEHLVGEGRCGGEEVGAGEMGGRGGNAGEAGVGVENGGEEEQEEGGEDAHRGLVVGTGLHGDKTGGDGVRRGGTICLERKRRPDLSPASVMGRGWISDGSPDRTERHWRQRERGCWRIRRRHRGHRHRCR